MKLEPLKGKKHEIDLDPDVDPIKFFDVEDVKSAYNFYITYCANATRFKKEQPEHWKEWLKYFDKHRTSSFSDWLLDYSFQDVIG